MPDRWATVQNDVETLIQTPGTMMSQLSAMNPAEIEVDVDVRESTFYRRGYIDCERWVSRIPGDPCRLVAGHTATPHTATVRMTEEEVRSVSQTLSARISGTVSGTISSSVGTQAGIDSTHVSISSTASATQSVTVELVSSETIAQQIRSALDVAETIGLDAHLPVLCKKWRVPYGLELVVTVRGKVKVSRRWLQNIQNPRTIQWSDRVTVDVSGAQVDSSVDPTINTATSFIEDTGCATCDDGSHLELREDGSTVMVPGEVGTRRETPGGKSSEKKGSRGKASKTKTSKTKSSTGKVSRKRR